MCLNSDEVVELPLQVTDQMLPFIFPETLSNITVSTKCALNKKSKPWLLVLFLRKKASIPRCDSQRSENYGLKILC